MAKNDNKIVTERNIIVADTFYFKREFKGNEIYHAIYVDSTKSLKTLQPLLGLDRQDSSNLQEYILNLKQKNISFQKFDIPQLVSEWIPVYQLNSKQYLYVPSDEGLKGHGILSDSLMLFYYMDGYLPVSITSFTRTNNNVYHLNGAHYGFGADKKNFAELNIYVVDIEKRLAVWEYRISRTDEYSYKLMVPKESARLFPIIVNDSVEKQRELEFDKVDFKLLIDKVK